MDDPLIRRTRGGPPQPHLHEQVPWTALLGPFCPHRLYEQPSCVGDVTRAMHSTNLTLQVGTHSSTPGRSSMLADPRYVLGWIVFWGPSCFSHSATY